MWEQIMEKVMELEDFADLIITLTLRQWLPEELVTMQIPEVLAQGI